MKTTTTGRGSVAILWGSAARFLDAEAGWSGRGALATDIGAPRPADVQGPAGGRPYYEAFDYTPLPEAGASTLPRDVDIVRMSWGGLPLPSEADIREMLPEALKGLPMDIHDIRDPVVVDLAVSSGAVDLPVAEGRMGCAQSLLAVEDGAEIDVAWDVVTAEESLSAALRGGSRMWLEDVPRTQYDAFPETAEGATACLGLGLACTVRRWLAAADSSTSQYIICDWRDRAPDTFAGHLYIGNGLRALANARTHVPADVWATAEAEEPFLVILRRLLDEGIHPTWIPDLRGDGSSSQEGPALRIRRRLGTWVAQHRSGQWEPTPLDDLFRPRTIRRDHWAPDLAQGIRSVLGLSEADRVAIERQPSGVIVIQPHAVGERLPLSDFGLSQVLERFIDGCLPRPASAEEIRSLRR